MNGFIYLENGVQHAKLESVRAGPFIAQERTEKESFACGDTMLAWGYSSGDVHCCRNGNDSMLILCGYISEVSNGPSLSNQDQAARFLLQSIDMGLSITALTGLLDRLHGSFAVFYRDFRRNVSLCLTDRVASRPLWKFWSGKAWVISTHATAISRAIPSVKVDSGALGAFLLYGGPVKPTKSLFAGIEAIQPGSVAMLDKTGAVNESHWYRFRHEADNSLSLTDWVELAAQRLVRSASRIANTCTRPVVFFSGGVDSRLTAAALKSAGANPLLVTLGDARNLEVKVSAQAARALGLQHVVILRDKHWYLRGLPNAVRETCGSFLWTHGHFAQAIQTLSEEFGVNVFLLGDFCEAFSKLFCSLGPTRQRLWTAEEFVRDFDLTRLPLYRPRDRNRTLFLLNTRIRDQVETALAQDISTTYSNLANVSEDPWIVGDQTFRWAAAATLPTFFMFYDVRSASAERNLMFDRDVHGLLEILPSRLRNGANLGARLIRRLDPPASRVVNSNSLLPMYWPPLAHKLSRKCKPFFGRVRRLILGSSYRTTGAWPEKSALYGGDPKWRDHINTILTNDELFDGELFDRDQVRLCWSALMTGNGAVAGDVEKLLQVGVMAKLSHANLERDTSEAALSR